MKWCLKWREFTLEQGRSKKCWGIAVGVDYVATRLGCPEEKARTRLYWFPDTAKAFAWLDTQIDKKIKKGYVEVVP